MTTDYKDSVFLPKTDFPMRGSLAQKEPELLARWKLMDLYGLVRNRAKGKPKFTLHDGPPFANGNIHIGHALNKILKDIINRTKMLQGYDVAYVPGWDCHGLPIEWKIEEQYRKQGKDKDQVPALQFRSECRDFAKHWQKVQSDEFQRLGIIGDWTHPYSTMTAAAEAQIVRELHKFLLNGLLYKGVKPVMWSTVEKTALADAEIEYHDHKSTTLWVKFPVIKTSNPALQGANIVIWTTTPWTIPANRAIAYGADIFYQIYEVESASEESLAQAGERFVIAEQLVEEFKDKAKIISLKSIMPSSQKGSDLFEQRQDKEHAETFPLNTVNSNFKSENIPECSHPLKKNGYDFSVLILISDFVTADTGTGFVHIAPGHGEDDFRLIKYYNFVVSTGRINSTTLEYVGGKPQPEKRIPIESAVDDSGFYTDKHPLFAGKCVYKPDGKPGDANGAVIKALSDAGMLLAKQNITHSYPHSWRSKAPVIFRTTPQWFIGMDREPEGQSKSLRELALDAIGNTSWVPEMGENRIRSMVEGRPDWCISRQRAWGVPIALFVDKKTGEPLKDKAVLERIAEIFVKESSDAWYARPAQDFLGKHYRAEDYEQVFDIVDVWFESGSTHAFVLDPMGKGGNWPELSWPATLYLEGSDQHRGWFQSSLLESCGTRGRAPYDIVLTHGFTLDEQGRKMSKSLGNTVAPQTVTEQMGADILRLWVVMSDYQQDLRIGADILKQIGDYYRRFRNTLRYLLGALDGMSAVERLPHTEMPELERWVLHRLRELDQTVRSGVDAFDFNRIMVALHEFCAVDLSAFYFDIRKDSLYCDRADSIRRRATRTVMEQLYECLTIWLAPFLCFTAEEAWLARHPDKSSDEKESVHLQQFPTLPALWQDDAMAAKWEKLREARRVVTGALERARADKMIGSSLQAKPVVYVDATLHALLQEVDFATLCIASDVSVHIGVPPPGAFTLADAPGIGVVVELAPGKKCERCWQVLPEVGKHADHPALCERCHGAVTQPDERAA